jgi:TolB-like protein
MAFQSGMQVGPYVITGRLGAGGMGDVYRARDPRLQRDVALKVVSKTRADDPSARAGLLREARSAATLQHPNICVVHDVGEADGQVFIAMECIDGTPLDAVAKRGVPWARVVDIGIQLADALGHAHRSGIIHRDLKGTNVLVTAEGRLKILDFGLAVHTSPDLIDTTRSPLADRGALAGTLAYMAPEILAGTGQASERSDIWSLGVLLYEIAAGDRPFRGATAFDLTSSVLRDAPQAIPASIPRGLATVIGRCLEKDPARRYASMSEVRSALEVTAAPGSHRPPVEPRRAVWPRRAIVWPLAGAAAALIAVAAWRVQRVTAPDALSPRIERLAVLPFANLSPDPSQAFFSEGITDEITTALAQVGSVAVISRTTAARAAASHPTLAELGHQLGVQAIVEGTVLKAEDKIRIAVRLIDVASDKNLWAGSFERDARNVIALQSDVARAVAREVRAELTPAAKARLSATPEVNPAAYEKYLMGRHFVRERNAESAKRGVDYLVEAAALDPGSATIQAALADAYREYDTWSGVGIGRSKLQLEAAANRAIELDNRLPEAHLALAQLRYWYEWDWAGAAREYQISLDGNPNLAAAHMGQALLLQTLGRDDQAVVAAARAIEHEPLSPTMLSDYGRILYRARRYSDAIDQFRAALRLDDAFVAALFRLCDAQVMLNDRSGSRQTLARIEQAGTRVPLQSRRTLQAIVLARDARPAEARRIAAVIEDASHGEQPGEYAFSLGSIYAMVGDSDQSLRWLETGIRYRAMYPLQLRDPHLDRVHSHPRFVAMLKALRMID